MATSPASSPQIILDLSRLLSRVFHSTPTGVDRCEMAYARQLLAIAPERLAFGAVHPAGLYGRLPRDAVVRFLDRTEQRWERRNFGTAWEKRCFATTALAALRPRMYWPKRDEKPTIYLQASPNNLTNPRLIGAILKREQARFVCLVHDLIPLQYPEYARPGGAALHQQRIDTIAALADGVIVNSHATLAALAPYLVRSDGQRATLVAHLGTDLGARVETTERDRPYFICIGTIEPRKNHLLLLNLWRRMAEEQGSDKVPKLILIGRRGWENEQIVDMLERCPSLKGCVEELGGLPDNAVQSILQGARALLLPSFAEGYGMPVAEALNLGVPVICSDLPALREAGGDVPKFLDPLDGPAWLDAITDFSAPGSAGRKDQVRSTQSLSPRSWTAHVRDVLRFCDDLPT